MEELKGYPPMGGCRKGQLLRKTGCNRPVLWREWEVNRWQMMLMSKEWWMKGGKEDQDRDERTE